MREKANLPIGIEDFGRIRRDGFYYVDKTVRAHSLTDLRFPGKRNSVRNIWGNFR